MEEEEEKEVAEEGAASSARAGAGHPVPLLRDGALHGGTRGAPSIREPQVREAIYYFFA